MSNTCIILTSTVNTQNKNYIFQKNGKERLETYLKSIRSWLHNTNLKIILIENNGYEFKELEKEFIIFKDRFEFISLNDDTNLSSIELNLHNSKDKGCNESFSINYAFQNSRLVKSCNFIIKITGRYYIPDFENFLNSKNMDNYDVLIQNDNDRCEVVGCHINNFKTFFKINIIKKLCCVNINDEKVYVSLKECEDKLVEEIYKNRAKEFANILICPIFMIEPTQRGGDVNKYDNL